MVIAKGIGNRHSRPKLRPQNFFISGLRKGIFEAKSTLGGRGLYTSKEIAKGERIHAIAKEYPKVYISQLVKWPLDKREMFLHYAYQGGHNFYYGSNFLFKHDKSFLMNHSCNPNCWFQGDEYLVARKNIRSGEELTMDYATFMSPFSLERPFICNCAAKNCRKIVKNTDCTLKSVKRRYSGHFLSHVKAFNKLIEFIEKK